VILLTKSGPKAIFFDIEMNEEIIVSNTHPATTGSTCTKPPHTAWSARTPVTTDPMRIHDTNNKTLLISLLKGDEQLEIK
jgi:hypothetical protein